jgi:copper chaperone CopZ
MSAVVLLGLLVAAVQEEPVTVSLAFEKMHCEECRLEVEAKVRRWTGFQSVQTAGNVATVVLDEKSPVPAVGGFPKDLVLQAARLSLRGTVSASGEKLTLVAKGSGAVLALGGAPDRLAEPKKALAGRNRFRLDGALAGPKSLLLESFRPAEWKE